MGQSVSTDMQLSWEQLPLGASPGPREGCGLVALGDALYLFGGNSSQTTQHNDVWIYGPSWRPVEPSGGGERPSARAGSACVAVGQCLYVFGGLDADRGWLNELWQFDTVTRVWTLLPPLGDAPSPRDKCAAVVVGGNIVLFGGFGPVMGDDDGDEAKNHDGDHVEDDDDEGDDDDDQEDEEQEGASAKFRWYNDLYVWNIHRGVWRRVVCQNALPPERAAHSMFLLQGRVWIFGGKCSVGGRQNDLWSVGVQDLLNAEAGCPAWLPVTVQGGVVPAGRSFQAACAVSASRVVIFGGISDDDLHLGDVHVFDFGLQSFAQPLVTSTVFPSARASAACACLGPYMYLYGGSSGQDVVHGDFYRLELSSVQNAQMTLPPKE